MYAFFEEEGTYKAGRVLSSTDAACQIELASGKRSKVKRSAIVFEFVKPDAEALMREAMQEAESIDLDCLYELVPQEEFGALDFAAEYFGGVPSVQQQAGFILKLHSVPHYFHRKGKGRYKPAPPETLKAAQAAIEKKRLLEARQLQMIEEIKAGQMPSEIVAAMPTLLFKPDKNSIAFKALSAASLALNVHPARLAVERGALKSAYDLHMQRFLHEMFPKGAQHADLTLPSLPSLPVAAVQAFSIDDIETTEIDDAFSVQIQPGGQAIIGIHIAAPALAILPGDAIDKVSRERMSTVYMPGDKITMLPDNVVQAFTLEAGRPMPAVSLYCAVQADGSVQSTETRIETVPIAANLRYNLLDDVVTEHSLETATGDYPFAKELAVLWKVALWESKERDKFRGKPENNNRTDFNFYVDWGSTQNENVKTDADTATVRIETRKRGAPLDRIVSELMILANSTWAKALHNASLPAVFRSQTMGRVRMSTHAAVHEAMGVAQYAWCTSPLRRYSDLVNQRQLLALIEHGAVAALKAPYKPKDADLFAVISAFDAQYSSYADFQSQMERYWCLRWLAQEKVQQVQAITIKEDLVRLVAIPLYLKIPGLPQGARGRPVKIEILRFDEIDLSVEARFLSESAGQATASNEELPDIEEASPAIEAVVLPGIENETP